MSNFAKSPRAARALCIAMALGASHSLALSQDSAERSLLTSEVLPKSLSATERLAFSPDERQTFIPVAPNSPAIDPSPTGAITAAPFEPELPPPASAGPPSVNETGPAPVLSAAAIEAALSAFALSEPHNNPLPAATWRAAQTAVRNFYVERSLAPVWLDAAGVTAAGKAALARLRRAPEDGLDVAGFLPGAPPSPESDSDHRAAFEIALSGAVVAYALEASGARVAPERLSSAVSERPDIADPAAALDKVAAAADPSAALQAYNPHQAGYLALRAVAARLRAMAPQSAADDGDAAPALHMGMVDPRVAVLRAHFQLEAPKRADQALVYDRRVAVAVASFQKSQGLISDGIVDAATMSALRGSQFRVQQAAVLANMEMWRWQPRELGETHIDVNIADYSLKMIRSGAVVHQARVIVGKPATPTPIFSNALRYILMNPSWEVPESIIKKEMLPKLAKDPDYLARMGFEVKGGGDRIVVRQPPGETNALGRILFMFPNDHSVYLHDTPSRGLFNLAERALSHGCVRLESPMALAELVMGGERAGWSQERLQSLVGGDERTIFLPRQIPIHLQYFTAFVDEGGALQFRADIYGLTRQVEFSLAAKSQG